MSLKNILSTFLIMSLFLGSCTSKNTEQKAAINQFDGREKAEYDYAYSLGVQALVYGWAPVMMDVALELQTSVETPMSNGQAPINQFGPITRLWDYRDRSYTTPNNDTYYLQGWVDVEEQPVVIYVPVIKNRYWMIQILDMYTESVVDLCNATVGDKGGYFMLAKEGYTGKIPAGVPVFYTPTRYMWIAGRIGVNNEGDREAKIARSIQSEFRMMTLNNYPKGGVQPEPLVQNNAPTVNFPNGLDWFNHLDKVLAENPLKKDSNILESYAYIGIGNGGTNKLPEVRKQALTEAFKDGFQIIVDAAKYSSTAVNGWNWEYDAGKYGADYLQRAAVNMNSIGLNSPERAMYPKRYVDSEGVILNGVNKYEITVPADMHVNTDIGGFWSITMYDAIDRFMVENEINRYKVGTITDGLIPNDDGSITIYISNVRPTDKKQLANWLPAPDADFMLQCRLYEPQQDVVNGKFELPDLYRIK